MGNVTLPLSSYLSILHQWCLFGTLTIIQPLRFETELDPKCFYTSWLVANHIGLRFSLFQLSTKKWIIYEIFKMSERIWKHFWKFLFWILLLLDMKWGYCLLMLSVTLLKQNDHKQHGKEMVNFCLQFSGHNSSPWGRN